MAPPARLHVHSNGRWERLTRSLRRVRCQVRLGHSTYGHRGRRVAQPATARQTSAAPAAPTTYTAVYRSQYYLTTSAGTGGSISPSSGWFDAGPAVTVTAIPSAGYAFANFTGALTAAIPRRSFR